MSLKTWNINWIPFFRVKSSQDEWINIELNLLFLFRAEFTHRPLDWLCLSKIQFWPKGWMEDTEQMGSLCALKSWSGVTPLGAVFQEGRPKRHQRSQNAILDHVVVLTKEILDSMGSWDPKVEEYSCIYVFNKQLLSTYYAQSTVVNTQALFPAWNAKQKSLPSVKCVVES